MFQTTNQISVMNGQTLSVLRVQQYHIAKTVMPLEKADHWRRWSDSMDWFKGKNQENPMFNRKIYGFRLRFSLRPVHWRMGATPNKGRMRQFSEPVDQTSCVFGIAARTAKTTQTIFDMICHETIPLNKSCFFSVEKYALLLFSVWRFAGKRQQFEASMPSNGSHEVADLHSDFQTRWVPTAQAILDEVHLLHWLSGFICSEIQWITKSLGIPAGTAPGFLLLVFLLSARLSKTKHDFARKKLVIF